MSFDLLTDADIATLNSVTKGKTFLIKKPDSNAEPTNRYHSLDGALACLVDDAQISGIGKVEHDTPSLF